MQTYNGTNRMMNKGRSGGRDYKTFERAFDHKLFVSYSEMNFSFSSSLETQILDYLDAKVIFHNILWSLEFIKT